MTTFILIHATMTVSAKPVARNSMIHEIMWVHISIQRLQNQTMELGTYVAQMAALTQVYVACCKIQHSMVKWPILADVMPRNAREDR